MDKLKATSVLSVILDLTAQRLQVQNHRLAQLYISFSLSNTSITYTFQNSKAASQACSITKWCMYSLITILQSTCTRMHAHTHSLSVSVSQKHTLDKDMGMHTTWNLTQPVNVYMYKKLASLLVRNQTHVHYKYEGIWWLTHFTSKAKYTKLITVSAKHWTTPGILMGIDSSKVVADQLGTTGAKLICHNPCAVSRSMSHS